MLEKVKLALQISSNVFDSEITDLINASIIDLNIGGVDSASIIAETTDPILTRAIITYCSYQFELLHGNFEKSMAIKVAYDEQKAQLSMSNNYTTW